VGTAIAPPPRKGFDVLHETEFNEVRVNRNAPLARCCFEFVVFFGLHREALYPVDVVETVKPEQYRLTRAQPCVETQERTPIPFAHEHLHDALALLPPDRASALGRFEEGRAEDLAEVVGVERQLLLTRRRLLRPEALRRVARHPLDLDTVVEERVEGLEFGVLCCGFEVALLE
jgi:hypothetical protein